jgi:uncharacterized protein (TIGR03435 family)
MTVFRYLSLALAGCTLVAQTAAPRLEFEVASIKPSAPSTDNVRIGMHVDGAQVNCTAWTLHDYIYIAYRVKNYQVEGPDWINGDRFDISAKLPAGATREQVNDMLQTLLVDRFHLKFHRVQKEFPVYALVQDKGGSKLKESNLDGIDPKAFAGRTDNVAATGSGAGVAVDLGHGSSFTFANEEFQVKRLPTARFADVLARFVDRPVVDMTGLKGIYDYDFKISPEDYRGMLIRSAITAGVALQPEVERMAMTDIGESLASALEAAGLKLEPRKAPLDVIVVDHADHAPTAN